jgi:penicillin-binding protein 1A
MNRRDRQRRRARHRAHPVSRVLTLVVVLLIAVVGLGVLGIVGWVVGVAQSAPNLDQLEPRVPGQVSEVYAGDGSLLGYIASDVLRTYVGGDQLPKLLRDATVAIEDRRFYQHGGVDYEGILRAGVRDLLNGGKEGIQGGSTLTMQLVGNVYLPNSIRTHHNLRYKIVQAKLANELEAHHSKSWILTRYLNDVPYGAVYGRNAIGVGAASEMFFDKPVQRLDLAQMALLAGLPQAPTSYNPFEHPALARQRRSEVLAAMLTSGYITAGQERAADASPLQVQHNPTYGDVQEQQYVFDFVKQQLIDKLGQATVDRGGLKVYTTIDLQDQAYARHALLENEGEADDPAAALVSVDPSNGHILAIAQNTTYGIGTGETTFDYATQGERQTGSSFKPFVMMAMIHDDDGNPNSTYYDSHFLAPGWLPGYPTYSVATAENSYQGVINVTRAMALSDNTVFAQLGVDLGMGNVDAMAHAMGVTAPLFGNPAEAIGGLKIGVSPLQMSDAYATMANGGEHIAPTILAKVVLPSGKVVDFGDPTPTRVFSKGQAYAGTQVLEQVIQYGTGTSASYGCPAAGKTGTTSNYTDAWFVGYTPKLSTAVWVGYPNDTASMNDVNGLGPGYGGTLAAPIWRDFMQQASGGYCGNFTPPTDPWYGTPYFGKHSASASAYTYTYTAPIAPLTTTVPTTTSSTGGAGLPGTDTTLTPTTETPPAGTPTTQAPTTQAPVTPTPSTGGTAGNTGAAGGNTGAAAGNTGAAAGNTGAATTPASTGAGAGGVGGGTGLN